MPPWMDEFFFRDFTDKLNNVTNYEVSYSIRLNRLNTLTRFQCYFYVLTCCVEIYFIIPQPYTTQRF